MFPVVLSLTLLPLMVPKICCLPSLICGCSFPPHSLSLVCTYVDFPLHAPRRSVSSCLGTEALLFVFQHSTFSAFCGRPPHYRQVCSLEGPHPGYDSSPSGLLLFHGCHIWKRKFGSKREQIIFHIFFEVQCGGCALLAQSN